MSDSKVDSPLADDHANYPDWDPAKGDPQASGTIYYGFIGVVLVAVTIIALQALYFKSEATKEERTISNRVPRELAEIRNAAESKISGYHWVDSENDVVGIPMKRAEELWLKENKPK